jgi:tripartite ATP-independent transporter DctP family solute receptor
MARRVARANAEKCSRAHQPRRATGAAERSRQRKTRLTATNPRWWGTTPAVMPRRLTLPVLAALALVLVLLAGCGRVGGAKVIKLAHALDPSHPVHLGMVHFAERLAEKSGGRIRVDLYPSGQLGTERECIELLQLGGLGMTKASSSALEGFAEAYRVFGLPFLFRNEAHRWAALEGDVGRGVLRAAEDKFLRGLCYYDAGTRNFYTTTRRVARPEDLAGLKIRTQESPMAIRMVRALGASATPISFGELYTALQQGVVDGAENNPPSFHLSRHYELSRYYVLSEHSAVPDVLLISTHLWRQLSPEEQRWVQEAADESQTLQRRLWHEASTRALDAVRAAGVEIIVPDQAAFQARVAPLHDEIAREMPAVGELARRIREVAP